MSGDADPRGPSPIAVILGVFALCFAIAGGTYFSLGPDRFAALFGASSPSNAASKGLSIVGTFRLTDQNGKVRTNVDFGGRFLLIYFGYTYCPDVCPTTLTTMSDALRILGPKGNRIAPIFITVDPRRDTVGQLKMYVGHFDPRLTGLTGTESQIAKATKTFRVYFAKQKESAPGANDYLVDHTSIVYFLDPAGRYLTHFNHKVTAEAMAERLQKYL